MAEGPCLNPNCASRGKPHPNCRCYSNMSEGGSTGGRYCDLNQPHQPGCQFFADGGTISSFVPDAEFKPDQSAPTANFVPNSQFQPDTAPSDSETQANAMEAKDQAEQEQVGSGCQQVAAYAERAAKGVMGPLATLAETAPVPDARPMVAMGPAGSLAYLAKRMIGQVSPQDIQAREEANPIGGAVAEVGGLLSPVGEGAALEHVGSAAANKFLPQVVGDGILKGASRGAVKLAAENALYQGGDETSKMIMNDPEQSIGSAAINIGMAGILGGVAGGTLGAVSPLWKAKFGNDAGQLVKDFKARLQEHLDLPQEQTASTPGQTRIAYDPFTKQPREIPVTQSERVLGPEGTYDPFTGEIKNAVPQPAPEEIQPLGDTHGGRLADLLIKTADKYSGHALAGGIGATVGHTLGIPYGGTIGTLIGERALGPMLESVLPAITRPILEKLASGDALRAATNYGYNVVKGQRLADNAVQSVFSAGTKVLPDHLQSNPDSRAKLETALSKLQQDPELLANVSGQLGHYMPQHAVAAGAIASNAVQFLNSIRPQNSPQAMLDNPKPVSRAVQAQYNRALDIANQPLTVLEAVKNNTLTSHDMIALRKLYPALYTGLQHKIMEQMVSHVAQGGKIPYKARLGLSLFLGQHLDSTMSPQAIMAAQPAPPQPPPPQPKGQKLTQGAAGKMLKGAKSSQTPLQASESMHSTGGKA
jgi:hypothetical protein